MKPRSFRAGAFLAAALFLLLPALPSAAATLKFGEEAPLFTLQDLQGKKVSLADLAGPERKPGSTGVILVFFTTWCPVCKEELPVIDSLVDELSKRGISVLLIGYQEDAEELADHLRELKVTKAPALSDPSGRVGKKYSVRYLPTIYALDADGRVKDLVIGESDDVSFDLRKMADKLTAR